VNTTDPVHWQIVDQDGTVVTDQTTTGDINFTHTGTPNSTYTLYYFDDAGQPVQCLVYKIVPTNIPGEDEPDLVILFPHKLRLPLIFR
jgi:hypothetical protein